MYVAPLRKGQPAIRGRSFDVNRNVQSLRSFVACLKKCLRKSDFIHFIHGLLHVYSPGAEADSPEGHHFDVNKKALSLYPFVTIKKNLFEV